MKVKVTNKTRLEYIHGYSSEVKEKMKTFINCHIGITILDINITGTNTQITAIILYED